MIPGRDSHRLTPAIWPTLMVGGKIPIYNNAYIENLPPNKIIPCKTRRGLPQTVGLVMGSSAREKARRSELNSADRNTSQKPQDKALIAILTMIFDSPLK